MTITVSKGQERYQQYLQSDLCVSFREFMFGKKLPVFESKTEVIDGKLIVVYRMYRAYYDKGLDRVQNEGQWCKTKKEAKASYKATLPTRKVHRCDMCGKFVSETEYYSYVYSGGVCWRCDGGVL